MQTIDNSVAFSKSEIRKKRHMDTGLDPTQNASAMEDLPEF